MGFPRPDEFESLFRAEIDRIKAMSPHDACAGPLIREAPSSQKRFQCSSDERAGYLIITRWPSLLISHWDRPLFSSLLMKARSRAGAAFQSLPAALHRSGDLPMTLPNKASHYRGELLREEPNRSSICARARSAWAGMSWAGIWAYARGSASSQKHCQTMRRSWLILFPGFGRFLGGAARFLNRGPRRRWSPA